MTQDEKREAKLHWWKCQKCGVTFERVTKGEPRRCPMCMDRGVKTYEGYKTRWKPGPIRAGAEKGGLLKSPKGMVKRVAKIKAEIRGIDDDNIDDWKAGFEFLEIAAYFAREEYSADDGMITEVGKAIRRAVERERKRCINIVGDIVGYGINEAIGRIRQGGK